MVRNKIVVRYQDGRIFKGFTGDFAPHKDFFHLTPMDAPPGTKPLEVRMSDLKAVFFVKDLGGDPKHQERREFESSKPVIGRKIQVVFKDGETLLGTTQGYQPGRPGFFLTPADAESNNERCFVVSVFTQEIRFV